MSDAPPPSARLTYPHQVVINLVGYLVCADWRSLNVTLARAEIAARLPAAPLTGQPQVDAVLTAAAQIETDATGMLRARAAMGDFLFWRAGQAQALADAPTEGADHAA